MMRCGSTTEVLIQTRTYARTHARTILWPFWIWSGTTWHQKGKTNLNLLQQEIVSGNGISWPYANLYLNPDTTMPASHRSFFYRPDPDTKQELMQYTQVTLHHPSGFVFNHCKCFTAFCSGLSGWASTGTNIRPSTPIMIINHPLSASSIYYDPSRPPFLYSTIGRKTSLTTFSGIAKVFCWWISFHRRLPCVEHTTQKYRGMCFKEK